MLLGLQAELEDHGKGSDSRPGTFSSMGSKPDGSEGGFYGIGGP
jgi:hypothetical protein